MEVSVCGVCDKSCSGAHKCVECGIIVHAICGRTVGEEGYGSKVICFKCEGQRPSTSSECQDSSVSGPPQKKKGGVYKIFMPKEWKKITDEPPTKRAKKRDLKDPRYCLKCGRTVSRPYDYDLKRHVDMHHSKDSDFDIRKQLLPLDHELVVKAIKSRSSEVQSLKSESHVTVPETVPHKKDQVMIDDPPQHKTSGNESLLLQGVLGSTKPESQSKETSEFGSGKQRQKTIPLVAKKKKDADEGLIEKETSEAGDTSGQIILSRDVGQTIVKKLDELLDRGRFGETTSQPDVDQEFQLENSNWIKNLENANCLIQIKDCGFDFQSQADGGIIRCNVCFQYLMAISKLRLAPTGNINFGWGLTYNNEKIAKLVEGKNQLWYSQKNAMLKHLRNC
uniref:uncharacterized protein LOC120329741 n=1 Tax=Styela clava TaxID=7725 RepID=UPI00193AA61C|nr:uncharacterized protein LOC120329741 [Styela clava]